MNSPLLDKEFLRQLFCARERETFIKVISYDKQKNIQDQIEGLATGGSINIDGASSTRRSCTLNIAIPTENQGISINDFYWSLCTEFELFIGLKNTVLNSVYDDIIWFSMGRYVVSQFSQNEDLKNQTINISGKDKMCLLNGELGGTVTSLTLEIDKYTEFDGTIKKIPISKIIEELVKSYGEEPAYNIVISGLDELGLELLEYRGDTPMYLYWDPETRTSPDHSFDGKQICFINGKETVLENAKEIKYRRLTHSQEIVENQNYTKVAFSKTDEPKYEIIKLEYGEIAGYRKVEEGLIYSGDLILNLGDSITTALDKIVEMLGNYEYFYNVDGQFIFQKKQNIVAIPAPQLRYIINEDNKTELFYDAMINSQLTVFKFDDDQLFTSKSKSYKMENVKNDFAVWGKRNERDIYARYAIDNKPEYYINYNNEEFYTKTPTKKETNSRLKVDWREIIYQMAIDYQANNNKIDFYKVLKNHNDYVVEGKTGYEKYYTDISAFWPQIYNIKPDALYEPIAKEEIDNTIELFTESFIPIKNLDDMKKISDKQNIYVSEETYLQRWIDNQNLLYKGEADKEPQEIYDIHNLYYEKNGNNVQIIESLDFAKNQAYLEDNKQSRLFLQLSSEDQQKVYFSSSLSGSPKKKLQEYLELESFASLGEFIPYNRVYIQSSTGDNKIYPVERIEMPLTLNFNDPRSAKDIVIWQYDSSIEQLSEDTVKLLAKVRANPGYGAKFYIIDDDKTLVEQSDVKAMQVLGEYYSEGKILWYKENDNEYTLLNDKFLSNSKDFNIKEKFGDKHAVYFYLNNSDGIKNFYKTADLVNINKSIIKGYDTETSTYFNIMDDLVNNKYSDSDFKDWGELYYYNPNKKMLLSPLADKTLFIEYELDKDSNLYQKIFKDANGFMTFFNSINKTLSGTPYPLKSEVIKKKIKYYKRYFNYYLKNDNDATGCWNKEIYEDFTKTTFWFDFIETDAMIGKFSIQSIGDRIKTEQNEKLTAIDFGAIPNVIYIEEKNSSLLDYDQIIMSDDDIDKTFSISSKGYSIKDKIEQNLNDLIKNNFLMSIKLIPVYNLDVNQQIEIKDNIFNISRITIPLNYNGTMSLEANKIG